MLSWLAMLREPVSIADLLAVQVARLAHAQVLESVDGLRRRSLVERGQPAGSFTLQSVVLEYVTCRLVEKASQEIQQGRLSLLIQHGLELAQAKEYARQTQERVLLTPLLDFLGSVYRERAEVEERLRELLSTLRGWDEQPRDMARRTWWRCCACCTDTCVGWISRSWPCEGSISKASRCKIRSSPGR